MSRPESAARRVAVITGGAAGIGQAFAVRLAQDGLDIAIADRNPATETADLVIATGRQCFTASCDVTDGESVRQFATAAVDALGPVGVLVNNAGIYPATLFLDMPFDEWQRVFKVNVDALYHTGQAFLPSMVASGWGRIINIASTTFHSGIPYNTHYTGSKGAVIGFTRSLAAEVGENGITVNAIAPGLVRTATTENGPQAAMFEMLAQQQAVKRTQEPADLVGTLSFLASDDAAFLTGQTLCVDGGWMRA